MEFKPLKSIVRDGKKITLPEGKYMYGITIDEQCVIIIPSNDESEKHFEEIV